MEFLGHQKAFAFLLGTGILIKSFISDRHQSIAKWMREDCPRNAENWESQSLTISLTYGTLAKVKIVHKVYT